MNEKTIRRLLQLGRITRHLPYLRGIGVLMRFYQFMLPKRPLELEVDNFDGDLKLTLDVRETIGVNVWHRPEFYNKNQRRFFCGAIGPGSVVLDVGANVGIYTLLAAKRGARVYAVEADPANVEKLRHHVRLNGYEDRVTIFPFAVGDREDTVTLYRFHGNSGHSNLFEGVDPVQVPRHTVDSLGLPPIDVCKMDIEGSELSALRGMEGTIRNSPGMRLLVEYAEPLGATKGLLDLICDRFEAIYALRHPPHRSMGPLTRTSKVPAFCDLCAVRRGQTA